MPSTLRRPSLSMATSLVRCAALPLALGLSLAAAEPVAASSATPGASATVAGVVPVAAPAVKPFFGVRIDPNALALSEAPGLPVAEVVPNSTAAQLGIEARDRLLEINGKPVASDADLKAILGGSAVGDQIAVTFTREGASLSGTGTLLEKPRPAQIGQKLNEVETKLNELRQVAEQRKKEPSLTEILETIQSIERDLPKAVAAFKKQYPDGEFDIDIRIKIVSDKKATAPLKLGNVPGAIPGPAAGSTTAAGSASAAGSAATGAPTR